MKSIDKIICKALKIKISLGVLSMIIMVNASGAQTISQKRASLHKIKSLITQKYPEAGSVWILDGYCGYKARFKTQDVKYVSSFSLKNEWLQTERKVNMADIPDSVKQSFKNTKYNKAKVLSAKKLMLPEEPSTLYLLEVRCTERNEASSVELGNTKNYKLYFTSNGRLAKEEVQPGETIQSIPWGGQ
jgi:hypothetical protein